MGRECRARLAATMEGFSVCSRPMSFYEVRPAEKRDAQAIVDVHAAATQAAYAGIVPQELLNAQPRHMEMVLARFRDMGLDIEPLPYGLRVAACDRMQSIDVATLPYPGIATDYKPLIITMLSVADGVGIVTENLYPGRFRYVEELQRLGADIRTSGHHAVVRGVPRLSGAPVRAHDIRAGAAMVVAGLAAEGATTITGVHHIDRGYDDLVGRLRAVGADIERFQLEGS